MLSCVIEIGPGYVLVTGTDRLHLVFVLLTLTELLGVRFDQIEFTREGEWFAFAKTEG